MRRTKKWWQQLTRQERIEIVNLERAAKFSGRSAYIPDDCCECGFCSTVHMGWGLCLLCFYRLNELIKKANGNIK